MKKIYQPEMRPKAHQAEAITQLLTENKANFDDQGLGKCKQAYDLAGKLLEQGKIDLMVLVSKASLRENFKSEISADARQLVVRLVKGGRRERALTYLYPSCHVLIVSYETVISDLHALKGLFSKNRVLFCLDEAHYIKNTQSQRSIACLDLSAMAHRAVVFTGTPAPNKPEDLFAQLKFIGLEVGNNVQDFRDRFQAPEHLREYLKKTSIRRKKETLKGLNLPPKYLHTIKVELTSKERVAYDRINDELLIKVRAALGRSNHIHIDNVLTKLLRLVQFTSNHQLLNADVDDEPSKLQALDTLVQRVVGKEGKKLIIWTNFQNNVEFLLDRYSASGAVALYGPLGREQISKNAKTFQEDQNIKILIAIPACAREGFTLTAAHNTVYLDRNFSFLDWAQSQDRIHRISQTKPCNVYVIEAQNTIDTRIDDVLRRKGHMQGYLLGDIESYEALENVTLEEIQGIANGSQLKPVSPKIIKPVKINKLKEVS